MSPLPNRFAALAAACLSLTLGTAVQAQSPAPTPPPAAADPDRVVARVDGDPVTERDLEVAGEDPALNLQGTDPARRREILIGYVIDLRLGARAAAAMKLDAAPLFVRRVAYLRDKLLVDDYLDAKTRNAVTPEAERKLYEESSQALKPEEEVHARHILLAEEAAARAAYGRVKGGEDFAKVAAELSTDPGSKTDGGDLGFFTKDRMVAPFAEAAFRLKPGEISEPVQSQFGWHVIQVVERRTKPVPTFAEMKDQIDQYLTRRAQQEAVLELRGTGKVERLDPPAK